MIDCAILSVVVALGLGSIAYFFGPELLHIYSEQADVIACGMEILSYTTMTYFLCRSDGSVPWGFERNGLFHSAYDPVYYRNRRHADSLDLWTVPDTPVTGILFISYPASWIATIVMQVICFWFVRRKIHREKDGYCCR